MAGQATRPARKLTHVCRKDILIITSSELRSV
jgi:hypothetical protein